MVLWMPGPKSYTGEDVAELLLPGNPLLLGRIVAQLIEAGVSAGLSVGAATAGEFTFRAWRHGTLELAQAESVMQLVTAETDADLHAAQRAAGGHLHAQVLELSQSIAMTLALTEAGIDFVDEEDVVLLPAGRLVKQINGLCDRIRELTAGAHGGDADDERPLVQLRGRPSAGKSTLFNALLGRQRAVTQSTPHTTRDELVEACRLSDGRWIRLVDTPGSDTTDSDDLSAADLHVWCVPPGDAFEASTDRHIRTLVVRTKCDEQNAAPGELGTSAKTGEGLSSLLEAIGASLSQHAGAALHVAVSARQRALLERVTVLLASAGTQASADIPTVAVTAPELIAAELRESLDLVGQISGDIPPDDVLGLVFSSFCIGK
jgi:tRNA modification GTPase